MKPAKSTNCDSCNEKLTIDPGEGYRLLGPDEEWLFTDGATSDVTRRSHQNGWFPLCGLAGTTTRKYLLNNPQYLIDNGQLYVRRKIEEKAMTTADVLLSKLNFAKEHAAILAKEVAGLQTAYDEEIKIKAGDWVVPQDNFREYLTKDHCYQVDRIVPMGDLKLVHCDCGKGYSFFPSRFRKATSAEIKAHLKANPPVPPLPEIHGYEGQYKKNGRIVQYGCAEIGVELLQDSKSITNNAYFGNRAFRGIVLDSGKTLAVIDIKAILAHVDYVNSH